MAVQLPLKELFAVFFVMAVLNVFTWHYLHKKKRAEQNELFMQLLFDVLAFSVVLYLTGGATNPFAWFYLIPLVISATLLTRKLTWLIAFITISIYSFLMFKYIALPGEPNDMHAAMGHMEHGNSFSQHILGMWFGFVMSAGLVAHFVVDMATTLRERDRYLANAREKSLRDEKLISLGTLAAGAAHELGTPLGSISLLATDLLDDYPVEKDEKLNKKLNLIHQQVQRCKTALSAISASAGEVRADAGRAVNPYEYIKEIISEWKLQTTKNELSVNISLMPINKKIIAERTITQAFINVLNNASEASENDVELQAEWGETNIVVHILDRGEGISEQAVNLLGDRPFSEKPQGLGVGLFISYAAINRFGGSIKHHQREGGGTQTTIELPYLEQENKVE